MSNGEERWSQGPAVLESVWRYRWAVLAATLAFGAVGYLTSRAQDAVYETSSTLYLTSSDASDIFGQSGAGDLDRYVPQQTARVTSTPVLMRAADLLGEGGTPGQIADQVDATGSAEVGTLTITATDGSPDRAAAVVNAVATAYQETVREAQLERAERAAAELEGAAADLEAQIAELAPSADADGLEPATQGDAGQIGVLSRRLSEIDALVQQLRVDARLFGSGVEFVEEASAPSSPIAPAPRRTAASTAVLGALLASAAAYWQAGRSRIVSSRDEPAAVLGVPLLGILPTYDVRLRSPLADRVKLEPRMAEAYRFAYSSLELVLREVSASSVMITSASPSVGKTETALQLAATASARGRDVLLIDGDVRMRGLSGYLGAADRVGLLDLAADPDLDALDVVTTYTLTDQRALPVVTAGQDPDDANPPPESWLGRALRQLTAQHELTIVDSPPLLAVADAATIAGYAEAVVLVVREGSSVEDLERVRQRLTFVGQRLVGYIYLSRDALQDTAFDYGLVRSRTQSPDVLSMSIVWDRDAKPIDPTVPHAAPRIEDGRARPTTGARPDRPKAPTATEPGRRPPDRISGDRRS